MKKKIQRISGILAVGLIIPTLAVGGGGIMPLGLILAALCVAAWVTFGITSVDRIF
jgi:hypothetical protein